MAKFRLGSSFFTWAARFYGTSALTSMAIFVLVRFTRRSPRPSRTWTRRMMGCRSWPGGPRAAPSPPSTRARRCSWRGRLGSWARDSWRSCCGGAATSARCTSCCATSEARMRRSACRTCSSCRWVALSCLHGRQAQTGASCASDASLLTV